MNRSISGFSMPAVLFAALVIGIIAAALPSMFRVQGHMKQKMDEAAYLSQIERILRRRYEGPSRWDFSSGSAVPTITAQTRLRYALPGCTATATNSCRIEVDIVTDSALPAGFPDPDLGTQQVHFRFTRDNSILVPPGQDPNINPYRFEIEYPNTPANALADKECDPFNPSTLGQMFLVGFEANGDPRCLSLDPGTATITATVNAINASCPSGRYLSALDLDSRRVECEAFDSVAKRCAPGEVIDRVNWVSSVVGGKSKISLNVQCKARSPSL